MSTKKYFVVLAVAVFLAATLWGQESKDPNENVKLLQEKIERLEKTIEFQQKKYKELKADYDDIKKQLDEQIQENERLKALVKNTDIVTESVKSKFDPNNGIIYLGKQRDKLWFERMYKQFCDKIVLSNGKYYNIRFLRSEPITNEWRFDVGTIAFPPAECKISQILKPNEILVIRPSSQKRFYISRRSLMGGAIIEEERISEIPEIIFCVNGIDTSKLAVGGNFNLAESFKLIYTGICKCEGIDRHCFTVAESLTREQFADAIKSGIRLITQREVNGKIIETPIR